MRRHMVVNRGFFLKRLLLMCWQTAEVELTLLIYTYLDTWGVHLNALHRIISRSGKTTLVQRWRVCSLIQIRGWEGSKVAKCIAREGARLPSVYKSRVVHNPKPNGSPKYKIISPVCVPQSYLSVFLKTSGPKTEPPFYLGGHLTFL